jgi:DNA-binding transcriptional regulator YiaG
MATVREWEQGKKEPDSAAKTVLNAIVPVDSARTSDHAQATNVLTWS